MVADVKELEDDINIAFNDNKAFPTYKTKREPYVILVNGKRVTLRTGRNTWSGPGAAKNAMRNHLQHLFWKYRAANKKEYDLGVTDMYKYQAVQNKIREFEDEWISMHVVYISLKEYSIAASKRTGVE